MTEDGYRVLGKAELLDEHQVVPFYQADLKRRVSVTKVDDQLYAFDDLCPEHNCALSAGLLTDTTLMCQVGGCEFDITTGKVTKGPATTDLGSYPVRETDGSLEAQVS